MQKGKKSFLIICLSIFLLISFVSASEIFTTDINGNLKTDFAPGEIAFIKGADFLPEHFVTIKVEKPDFSEDLIFYITDSAGSFFVAYRFGNTEGTYYIYATDGTNEASFVFTDGTGAVWTTKDDCGSEGQNVNKFKDGEIVFLNGAGFDPNTSNYWEIKGQPGSCDKNTVVANGTYSTNTNGSFCFGAYNVSSDDCGVYKYQYNGKSDNYAVEGKGCEKDNDCWGDYYSCEANSVILHDVYCDNTEKICKETVSLNTNCSSLDTVACQETYYITSSFGTCVESGESAQCVPSAPIRQDCRNELYCDGEEFCSSLPSPHCQSASPVNCSDSVGCTIDSCNEGTDSCSHNADNNLCSIYDLPSISQCNHESDNNSYTLDTASGFDSVCAAETGCTTGSYIFSHVCSEQCSAPCVSDENCTRGTCNLQACTCSSLPYCGDGNIDIGEECDDGNNNNGDGCSANCKIELCSDEDGDGVCDNKDKCPNSKPGEPVDEDGCDIFQFCELYSCGKTCLFADWKDNEEAEYPKDCTTVVPLSNGIPQQPICVPTQFSEVCAG